LAEVLNRPPLTSFWAVDKLILVYFAFTSVVVLGWWNQVSAAAALFTVHLVGVALLIFEVKRPNRTSWLFRNWYPLPYVGFCYKEMALLIPAVRHTDADQWLADLDFRIWHVYPTVWLERIQSPLLTEFLQTVYTLFVPAVLLVAVLMWRKRLYPEFQYYAFLIALGFLASYVGYLIVPARGPRFLLRHLQHIPLQGLWLFRLMQATLDRLESAYYDCFPSGHTLLTILAWWGSRLISKKVFWAYLAYTPFLIFATVYCRYHYTVDVLAGAGLGFVLILATPAIYKKLSQGV
jgi:membrane-associated phospholipid phosphatase